MIKELTVKNWKSFGEATFYIDPLTILIGANASGKSNLLDTFLFLMRISSNVGISQAINGDVNLPAIRGGFEWVCRKPHDRFTITLIIEKSERQDYQYTIILKQLEDIEQLPKLIAGGSIGELSTEGKIEQALKMETER